MRTEHTFGPLNGHAAGIVIKEMVRRATVAIRDERDSFDRTAKAGYDGSGIMNDVFTSADTRAQEIYLRHITECFPPCGVVAEEKGLRVDPKNGCTAYFTVDPVDGTKAFIRRQSDGIGTMIALADGNEVLSAYIGDINTQEVYGYRPDSNKVFRITHLDYFEELGYGEPFVPGESYALLRDPTRFYSSATRKLLQRFKNYEVIGASIGIWAARLWKREIKALFMQPGYETPWDSTPVIGISQKLGYVFMRPTADGKRWEEYVPELPTVVTKREHDTLIVHTNDVPILFR